MLSELLNRRPLADPAMHYPPYLSLTLIALQESRLSHRFQRET
jgi:hypothetical protein